VALIELARASTPDRACMIGKFPVCARQRLRSRSAPKRR
jgi:hypothetical protein